MEKIFIPIYNYFNKHKAVFCTCLVGAFLCTGFIASKIKLEEDISSVLPQDEKTEKLNLVFQNSKFLDKLVVNISLADSTKAEPDSLTAYAETFANTVLQQLQPYIHQVNAQVNDDMVMEMFGDIQAHLPVYLTDKDYAKIDSLTTPAQLKETLEHNLRTLTSPAGMALKQMIANDPVGLSFIGLKKLQQLQYDENYDLYDNYVMTKDQKHLLVFIEPAYPSNNTGKNAVLLRGLDKIIDSLQAGPYKQIKTNYFGGTAVAVGNAQQLRSDNLLTQGIAIAFIVLFIAWHFHKKRAPFLMLLPVVFGALFSLALVYLMKGSISVIALGTGSVVLGIAINYSLHVFNHYRHTKDIRVVLEDLAMPMTIGSFTTIGGFLCLEFVQSGLLRDIGLFAAFSLIGASLFSLIFLPHLIISKKEEAAIGHHDNFLERMASKSPEYNKWLVIGIFTMTAVFAYTSRWAGFESDMMKMNYMKPALKDAEADLNKLTSSASQSIYVITTGKNLDDALQQNEQATALLETLKNKGIVNKYAGVSPVMFSDSLQRHRIAKWNSYWTAEKKMQVMSTLLIEGAFLKYKATAFDNFSTIINTDYKSASNKDSAAIRSSFLNDYIIELPGKTMLVTLVKASAANKPALYTAFANAEANGLSPTVTITDKQYMTNRFVQLINTDFNSIAIMSSLLVFLVLWLTYGRIELALATFIPMLITWVWILGIMGMFGIKFNIINIIISTLIFGLGDDYSIFIMDGLLQEYKTGKKLLSSYKSSILLSAITTIAGLGVLIFAKHPALKSIAIISIIGIICVVMMSQILIPLFFNFLIKNRVKRKLFPWTFFGLLRSAFAFAYFLVGCLILTFVGFFLLKINFINKKKGKVIYHTILSAFTWSLMYIMGNLTKRIVNPLNEQFKTPAVVIANHQSFLDILVTTMLNPKLVLLTNKWVWNSPFFGNIVRMADYYPVAEGAESGIDRLAESVKNGYSIVIFPEGTRTVDGNMKRFHKGAFFLAEQLQIDVLPVMLHGTGYNMSKNDFLLKSGTITVKYLPRIKPTDTAWGEGHAARTKSISSYFKKEYKQLREEIEMPAYFGEQLIYNYLYKGPVLEWYMRVKLRLEKYYVEFNDLVPRDAKVLDIGCGYGFLSYMLHFTAPQRDITGIDYDEEKIATANHNFSKADNIRFNYSDVLGFEFERYDSIILSDILHYLQPTSQRLVIKKCIENLTDNGTVIIREGNAELKKRHKGTELTEVMSTKMFGFNKTTGEGLAFLSGNTIRQIADENNMVCTEVDNSKFTSNIIFLITHRA